MLSLQICLINIFSILYIIHNILVVGPCLNFANSYDGRRKITGGAQMSDQTKFWFCKIIFLSFLFVLLSIPFFNFLPFPSFFRIYNFLILFLFTNSIFNNLAPSFLPLLSLSFFLSFLLFHSNNYKPSAPSLLCNCISNISL